MKYTVSPVKCWGPLIIKYKLFPARYWSSFIKYSLASKMMGFTHQIHSLPSQMQGSLIKHSLPSQMLRSPHQIHSLPSEMFGFLHSLPSQMFGFPLQIHSLHCQVLGFPHQIQSSQSNARVPSSNSVSPVKCWGSLIKFSLPSQMLGFLHSLHSQMSGSSHQIHSLSSQMLGSVHQIQSPRSNVGVPSSNPVIKYAVSPSKVLGFTHQMHSPSQMSIINLFPEINSPFHEISASWRKCIFLPSAVKHSVHNGGVVWSCIRVALIWGSAQNLFLTISVIMVVLSIQRSYMTDGNHTFIIPDYFSYQMRISGRYFKASSFLVSLLYPMATAGMVDGCYRAI